jgi:hypothetical protein
MKLVLDIPDGKADDFISHLQKLGYVSWKKAGQGIPHSQQNEVIHRLQMIENGTMKARSWNAFIAELDSKNGI